MDPQNTPKSYVGTDTLCHSSSSLVKSHPKSFPNVPGAVQNRFPMSPGGLFWSPRASISSILVTLSHFSCGFPAPLPLQKRTVRSGWRHVGCSYLGATASQPHRPFWLAKCSLFLHWPAHCAATKTHTQRNVYKPQHTHAHTQTHTQTLASPNSMFGCPATVHT